jgi:protein TonB
MDFAHRPEPGRRLVGLGGVVVFHVLLIYALVSGLARKAIEVLPAPIETKILEDIVQQEEPPPPPPPPDFETPPPPFIPPPEINIARPPPPTQNTITTVTTEKPVAPPPPVSGTGTRVAPVVKAKNCRDPDYPPVSERLEEEGTVVLGLLVGVDGKVTDSRVEKSSGHERLDKAAQAALSRCRFTPGTFNGNPEAAWARIQYRFKLPE